MLISLGLCVGIAVFAVFAVQTVKTWEQMRQDANSHSIPTDFGSASFNPEGTQASNDDSLLGLAKPNPAKFIPIVRENPHPGEIAPFLGTAPFGQPPYRQPPAGGVVWENCAYRVPDAGLVDLIAHYDREAKAIGMRLTKQHPTGDSKRPGGIVTSWSAGSKHLRVTAWPLPTKQRQPPLKTLAPLEWVVQYSYPETNAKP